MLPGFLACTVRHCGRPLTWGERALTCEAAHSFDRARSGYVNLLQPQDRRSRDAGDPRAVVEARARLIGAGIGRALFAHVVARASAVGLEPGDPVVDLGCGAGELLASFVSEYRADALGIDISQPAVEFAARRFPYVAWVVANADRRLPIVDAGVRTILSMHGRRNPAECARVLSPGGVLVLAVPARDDLIELRGAIGGRPIARERARAVIEEHSTLFTAVEHATVRERRRIDPAGLRDLLRVTYRGERHRAAPQVEALAAMEVTFASEVFVFRRPAERVPAREP